jgi:hypothetical protein
LKIQGRNLQKDDDFASKKRNQINFPKNIRCFRKKKAKMTEIVLPERDFKLRIKSLWAKARQYAFTISRYIITPYIYLIVE